MVSVLSNTEYQNNNIAIASQSRDKTALYLNKEDIPFQLSAQAPSISILNIIVDKCDGNRVQSESDTKESGLAG